jgi:hypothetical protein
MRFLKSPEGGVNCIWFRTAGFPGSGGVNCGKRFLRFFHTFSRQNTHVQMKAPTPSLMKPADDRQQVLFREALMQGRRGQTADFVTEEWWRELHNIEAVRISDLKEE